MFMGDYFIHSPVDWVQPFCCAAQSREKKILQRKEKAFFCFFFPTASLVLFPNRLHFLSKTTEVVALGVFCTLIYFSSFHRLLGHLKYGTSQGKHEMLWLFVCSGMPLGVRIGNFQVSGYVFFFFCCAYEF